MAWSGFAAEDTHGAQPEPPFADCTHTPSTLVDWHWIEPETLVAAVAVTSGDGVLMVTGALDAGLVGTTDGVGAGTGAAWVVLVRTATAARLGEATTGSEIVASGLGAGESDGEAEGEGAEDDGMSPTLAAGWTTARAGCAVPEPANPNSYTAVAHRQITSTASETCSTLRLGRSADRSERGDAGSGRGLAAGFGNGRSARQLFQTLTERHAQRTATLANPTTQDLIELLPQDVPPAQRPSGDAAQAQGDAR